MVASAHPSSRGNKSGGVKPKESGATFEYLNENNIPDEDLWSPLTPGPESVRGGAQSDDLTSASSQSFRSSPPSGRVSILAPRAPKGSGARTRRADDPTTIKLAQDMLDHMNTGGGQVKSEADHNVPVGVSTHHTAGARAASCILHMASIAARSACSNLNARGDRRARKVSCSVRSRAAKPCADVPLLAPHMLHVSLFLQTLGSRDTRLAPMKGGRATHPRDVIESRGKLTPLQMHRILSSVQQRDPKWTMPAIAAAYSISENALASMLRHLALPFTVRHETGTWLGSPNLPPEIAIQKALGHHIPCSIMGQHLTIEKRNRGSGQ
jgi:hypothetical protein